jgi:hypothetical protein
VSNFYIWVRNKSIKQLKKNKIMKEFMLLFRGGDFRQNNLSPEHMQAHMEGWKTWMEEMGKKGHAPAGAPLEAEGKLISGTKHVVSDGPFIEGKEIVGGYLLIKATDLNQAIELSKGCPVLEMEDGVVEVRAIQMMDM